ncbi:hypothetical protein [Acinetobacter sp. WZC-1]|uniref:hypothetical protein n=1 Tax=Acinetobacter sp. WZC-1 TaxID=3459034 RepID=UPI00403D7BC7
MRKTGLQKNKIKIRWVLCLSVLAVSACDSGKNHDQQTAQDKGTSSKALPHLTLKETRAAYALPFCEKKDCIEMDIQTIQTQDAWLNQWITDHQAMVVQSQIGLRQNMTLQQAVDAYIKKSDAWQAEFDQNPAYELHMQTRIASQRNQYVLLQISVNSRQADTSIQERQYFFVADRKMKKNLKVLDVIQAGEQNKMNGFIQTQYLQWLNKQDSHIKQAAPKKLYWGQSDWFFDGEGVGLHYRTSEITDDGSQLDIYLSKEQTQQVLKPEVYKQMF